MDCFMEIFVFIKYAFAGLMQNCLRPTEGCQVSAFPCAHNSNVLTIDMCCCDEKNNVSKILLVIWSEAYIWHLGILMIPIYASVLCFSIS